MFKAPKSAYLVPFDGSFKVAAASTAPTTDGKPHKGKHRRQRTEDLNKLQRVLAAGDKHSILLVFQAMDAAGKDSTIRSVMQGVDPSGCQVFSFKKPSNLELDHDFLWRTTCRLPERGRIGIFNRSQYEEVLVVRVHPKILGYQKLPGKIDMETVWDDRLTSIRQQEEHLARNGTVILKFWLNVSKEEQRRRFISRIDEPRKNWKFSAGDVAERARWSDYMRAYEDALSATSHPWAPWYAIPADSKSYMRCQVADILVRSLQSLALEYPTVDPEKSEKFDEMRRLLEA